MNNALLRSVYTILSDYFFGKCEIPRNYFFGFYKISPFYLFGFYEKSTNYLFGKYFIVPLQTVFGRI